MILLTSEILLVTIIILLLTSDILLVAIKILLLAGEISSLGRQSGRRNTDRLLAHRRASSPQTGYFI